MYLLFGKLIVAEAMFASVLKRRRRFILRLVGGVAAALLIQYLYELILSAAFTERAPFVLYRLQYVLIIITTTFAVYFCFDCSFIKALACGTGGYATQNLIHCVGFFLNVTVGLTFRVTENIALNGFLEFLFYLACYIPFFIWIRFSAKKFGDSDRLGVPSVLISLAVVVTTIIISTFVRYTVENVYAFVYLAICNLMVIGNQLGLFEKSAIKKQMETIQQLDRAKWEQYQLLRESVDQINIKCHDLKQQINVLLADGSESRKQMLEETVKALGIYDSITTTGNEALNIVLTEKHLLCERHNIKCSCIVDGKALDFMDSIDIASLFGNAMDNAIESVKKFEDREKRFINLNVSRHGNMLIIHVENYNETPLKIVNGLPETTKENNGYHGFGMKSIRQIVEKYHGNLLIKNEDNIFSLDILFA